MKKVKFLLFAATALIVFACSKDMKVVKQLDGTWKVSSITVDGVAEPDSTYKNTTYTFNKCKVKKEDCDGSISEDGLSIPFTYKVSDKGKKFSMTMNIFGFNITESGDIVEHSKDKFVFKVVEDGETTVTTLVK